MSRNNREQTAKQATAKQALAARMSAQFDRALSEAAETMDSFGPGWDDTGPDPDGYADEAPDFDLLPLEFQLADLERAVDSILEERDRFLHGAASDPVAAQGKPAGTAVTGKESGCEPR